MKTKVYNKPRVTRRKIKINNFSQDERYLSSIDSLLSTEVYAASGGTTCGGCSCLLADMKVKLPDNHQKSIQDIKVGDSIVTYNTEKNREEIGVVTNIIVHPIQDRSYLVLNDSLKITPIHPVYIENSKWVEAGTLKEGDVISGKNDKKIQIDSIERKDERINVYDLQVDSNHNFFAQGILLHNKVIVGG